MNKSIYDEALQELKDLEIILYYDVSKIKTALKQAQKQEKLLELYKELSDYVCEDCYAHKLPEITRLKILIKELEK